LPGPSWIVRDAWKKIVLINPEDFVIGSLSSTDRYGDRLAANAAIQLPPSNGVNYRTREPHRYVTALA
jgi:hypothetical protein